MIDFEVHVHLTQVSLTIDPPCSRGLVYTLHAASFISCYGLLWLPMSGKLTWLKTYFWCSWLLYIDSKRYKFRLRFLWSFNRQILYFPGILFYSVITARIHIQDILGAGDFVIVFQNLWCLWHFDIFCYQQDIFSI